MCTENENIIENHFVGDTWNGGEFFIEELAEDGVTVTGVVDLTGCSVRSHFRKTAKGSIAFEFKTEDETIKIVDLLNEDLSVLQEKSAIQYQPRKMDYDAGSYVFDIEITFPDGCVKTLFKDGWNLVNDVSHD